MVERQIFPEGIGDDKPTEFYEREEAKRRFEAGLEAALREKSGGSLSEGIGDSIDHRRQDENHRA
jgi:hypothetical protein